MSLIPRIVIPLAFASLIQNILFITANSTEGLITFVMTMISWHLFVNKTARGKMVFDAWVAEVNHEK